MQNRTSTDTVNQASHIGCSNRSEVIKRKITVTNKQQL